MTAHCRPLLLALMCLCGCSQTPEERAEAERFALSNQCVHRHGSPVVEGDKFIRCEYPWSIHLGKKNQ
jgi:hypothetical protein